MRWAFALATLLPALPVAAAAATVRLLPLPEHATIEPFAARSQMAVARDGRVAATVTASGYRTEAIVWDAQWRPRAIAAATVAGFDSTGGLLLDGARPRRWTGGNPVVVDTSYCEDFPQRSTGVRIAGILDDGAAVVTMQSPATIDLDDTSGRDAPNVFYLRSRRCLDLGNGIAEAVAGMFSAGYVAFINRVPAPSNVVSNRENFTAIRWQERTPSTLGPGVALAVNAGGAAAGTDVPPGEGASFGTLAHARFWPASGSAIDVTPHALASAAYAVDARDRVAGMLQESDGRHYAFLWSGGTLRRLDDAVPAAGWRFECAYAFAPDGGIAGIGTYRGKAAAFLIQGL